MLSVSKMIQAIKPIFNSRIVASVQIHTTSVNELSQEEKLGLPARPKSPLTPYVRYLVQIRPSVVKENPNMHPTLVIKEIAQRYKTADPALIKKFTDEYRKEREEFTKKRFLYESKLTAEQRQILQDAKQALSDRKAKIVYKRRLREHNKPKRPPTGFILYNMDVKDKIKRDPTKPFIEHQKMMAKNWNELPEAKKKVYEDITKAEMEKYKQDLAKWEHKMVRLGNTDLVREESMIDQSIRKPKRRRNKQKAASDSDLD